MNNIAKVYPLGISFPAYSPNCDCVLRETRHRSHRKSNAVSNRVRVKLVSVLMCIVGCLGVPAVIAASPTNSFSPFFGTNAYVLASMELLDNKQKLCGGDRISFRVVEDQEEAKSRVVSDSGEIEVPHIGRVSVLNKTCQELAYELKPLLEKDLYYQATVIIAIETLNNSRGKVYLVGEIRTAGPQDIPSDEPFTVSKAIMKAGGFSKFANKKSVKVTRNRAGRETEVFVVDVATVLEKSRTDKDLILVPGDIILVPARLFNF